MPSGLDIRPTNKRENRVDRRLARHQTGKRRVVLASRQRKGRTLTFVVNREETPDPDWAHRILKAWAVEIAENKPGDLTVVVHPERLHISFSNNAVLQIATIVDDKDLIPFDGQRFDIVSAVLFSGKEAVDRVNRLRVMVTRGLQ